MSTKSAKGLRFYLINLYEWFLDKHSSDFGKSILTEVGLVINGGLVPAMQIIAHGVVALVLIMLLVVVDPFLTAVVAASLCSAYGSVYFIARGPLKRLGDKRVSANQRRFRIVQETFGGIKEVKVSCLEKVEIKKYAEPARLFAQTKAASQVAAQLPRYFLEGIAFSGIFLVLMYLMRDGRNIEDVLPTIAAYVLAGYRLIPALQNVYVSLSRVRFSAGAIETFHEDYMSLLLRDKGFHTVPEDKHIKTSLKKELKLTDIEYRYPKSKQSALSLINLTVPAHHTVAFVGSTGSGKTTIVDLIIGLLSPSNGHVSIDGVIIDGQTRSHWQRSIGYVPQQIYLSDGSISSNIAFGVSEDKIDYKSVIRAARAANLHDFVVSDLPDAYETRVGERGVKLSGGQRQRMGIARALYRNPEILILDEATSALDVVTERLVMNEIHNLNVKKTIIIVAHRLSTVKDCDCIFLLEKGKVVAQGSYEELANSSEKFRKYSSLA